MVPGNIPLRKITLEKYLVRKGPTPHPLEKYSWEICSSGKMPAKEMPLKKSNFSNFLNNT